MKVLSYYNNKGGVGKTTVVINVASELARENKVLVIDLDGQANCSRFYTDPVAGLETALVKKSFSPSVALKNTRYENIDVLTATAGLNFTAAMFEQLPDDEQTANVQKVIDINGGYDYVLIDLPPALNRITEKVIALSDCVFVPIELGIFAIQGIPAVTEVLADADAKFGGCIVNKFDRENPADTELLELLKELLGDKVLNTTIPFSRVIKNSFSYKMTANEYMKWTAAAQAFEDLSREIKERTDEI